MLSNLLLIAVGIQALTVRMFPASVNETHKWLAAFEFACECSSESTEAFNCSVDYANSLFRRRSMLPLLFEDEKLWDIYCDSYDLLEIALMAAAKFSSLFAVAGVVIYIYIRQTVGKVRRAGATVGRALCWHIFKTLYVICCVCQSTQGSTLVDFKSAYSTVFDGRLLCHSVTLDVFVEIYDQWMYCDLSNFGKNNILQTISLVSSAVQVVLLLVEGYATILCLIRFVRRARRPRR